MQIQIEIKLEGIKIAKDKKYFWTKRFVLCIDGKSWYIASLVTGELVLWKTMKASEIRLEKFWFLGKPLCTGKQWAE